jgi:Glycosyltransferase sugar-binding region containing DXD motif
MNIPKIFHFIWAGGTKTLPYRNIIIILDWMQANPSIDFWLWIDKKTAPGNLDLVKFYKEQFKAGAVQDKNLNVNLNELVIKDIEEESIVDEYIRYEIDRLRPNYGASSDMLRYAILYKFGGVYFDSDVAAGETSLESTGIFDQSYEKHALFVDPNSQDKWEIGNDAFISTIRNPLMKAVGNLIRYNYSSVNIPYVWRYDEYGNALSEMMSFEDTDLIPLFRYEGQSNNISRSIAKNIFSFLDRKTFFTISHINKTWQQFTKEYLSEKDTSVTIEDHFPERCPIQMRAYLFDKQVYIKDITVKLTGYYPVVSIITPYLGDRKQISVKEIAEEYRTTRRELGLLWTNRPVRNCNKNTAIAIIIASIRFELKVMKILRLEDHVENLAIAANYSINEAILDLLSAVENIDFQHAEAIQNTLRYTNMIKFYKHKEINAKKYFHLDFDKPFRTTGANGLHISAGILRSDRIDEICTIIKENKELSQDVIKELDQIIAHGIFFLNKELDHFKKRLRILNNSPKSAEKTNYIDMLDYYFSNVLKYSFDKYEQINKNLEKVLSQSIRLGKLTKLQIKFSKVRGSIREESIQLDENKKICPIF